MPHFLKTAISALFLVALLTVSRGSDLPATPTTKAIACMKSADSAWIFTVDGVGARGPARGLSKTAREQIVALISDPGNFGKPLNMPIDRPAVGIEFRKGDRTLTIYTTWEFGYFYDAFPAGDFLAVLGGETLQSAREWQKHYFPRPTTSLNPAPGN